MGNAEYMGSASSTATGATLPSFGRFVYTRIKTATQDAQQRIQEGKEVWLKHLLPVLPEADPGVQGGLRHHRQRQGWHHHCPRPKKGLRGYWTANQRWGGQQHGWRGPWTNQLHPDGHTVGIFLSHADHDTDVTWATDDGREDGA